jgi:RNA polymerase sigma factor (sigma-70 family)
MDENTRLAHLAVGGDKQALEKLVGNIRDMIFGLAVRMLYDPHKAEDATQEILIKIVTRLHGFRGDSRFTTWAFAVAANHLKDARRSRAEHDALPLDELDGRVILEDQGPWDEALSPAMQRLIVEEMRISCLQGLLLSLDRPHRLAYILAEVFGLNGVEGATVLGITPEAFRKRLSRARARISGWMLSQCSLINPDNPCSCVNQAKHHLHRGDISPGRTIFAGHSCKKRRDKDVLQGLAELDGMRRIAALFRADPDIEAPGDFAGFVRDLVESDRFAIMRGQNH